ncbi:MAG TPA: glycine betaine/L-proline ABC transporter ATP-binding protein [Candidatus Mcinerneyibacterium sp.]|nr:glycine betaine/L-proline ABC transporter ATP-binding protein [Candidatus Mcinerneyibacterium sp.]
MIKVNNLYKIFGKKQNKALKMSKDGVSKKEILKKTGATIGVKNASFEVKEGEIFVIMGLSGSGKSTLLRCINRLIEPTEGEIIIDDENILGLEKKELREFRKNKFGMVFQHFGLFPYRTVVENAEFGLEIQKMEPEKRKEKAMKALKQVGLKGWESQYPESLSGGMKQRVGLARALAVDADYLLMDEPFSALDPLIKREMQDNLIDLQEEIQKTIIFITHDLDEALKVGDRIAIMKDGVIVQTGGHEEILANAKSDYVEDFVKDVNRSRVYTAEECMIKPQDLLYIHEDGPKSAVHKMEHYDIDSMFVLDKNKKYLGKVKIENAIESSEKGKKDLKDIIIKSKVAYLDDNLSDLFTKIVEQNSALPVIDKDKKFYGMLTKTTLIANLSNDEIDEDKYTV